MNKASRGGMCGYCSKPIIEGQSIALDDEDSDERGWGHADCVVVHLVSEGYTRWRIAELLTLSETEVRTVIRDLCSNFGVPMAELPAAFYESMGEGGQA